MANEINIAAQLHVQNGNLEITKTVSVQVDQEAAGYSAGMQSIGASSHEKINIASDIDTNGYAWFRNLDADETVRLGLDVSSTFYPMVELAPGEVAMMRLYDTDIYALSLGSGEVDLEWVVLED